MARIIISEPRGGEELEDYLRRLVGELKYILANLDEDNMTAAYNSAVRERRNNDQK